MSREPRYRWGTHTKRIMVAAAVAVLVGGGGAVALAATEDDDGGRGPGDRGAPPATGQDHRPDDRNGPDDRPSRMGGPQRALHGEYVAKDGSDFVTYAMQIGEIAALDDDSVNLRSEDGFTREYRLGDAEPADLAVGDRTRVLAKIEGETATVVRIGAGGKRTGPDAAAERPPGPPEAPAPPAEPAPPGG